MLQAIVDVAPFTPPQATASGLCKDEVIVQMRQAMTEYEPTEEAQEEQVESKKGA